MASTFTAAHLRKAVTLGLESLRAHRVQIDDANVYPVPDGDTGTNLVATLTAVAEALDATPDQAGEVARVVVRSATAGARGNSGVILAQWLRGFCGVLDVPNPGGSDVAEALKAASELAWTAMLEPREGTMLTVARAAADSSSGYPDAGGTLQAAAEAAREALAHTPDQLPILRAEGVVDAGGIGFCVVLDALVAAVNGTGPAPLPDVGQRRTRRARETGSLAFAFEVQYLLDAPGAVIPDLRQRLGAIGDSVAVVGAEGSWNVHVHTNDVDQAIAIGTDAGRAYEISIVEFAEQIAETRGLAVAVSPVAVLAIVAGDGFRRVLGELGAIVGEDTHALAIIDATDVIVLADARVDVEPDRNVAFIATENGAQAFAAMLGYSASRDLEKNVAEMRASMARTRTAAASSETELGDVVDGFADAEVITVFASDADDLDRVRGNLRRPGVGVDVLVGGQPQPRYLVVAE